MKLSSPEERFARALMRKLAAAGDTRQAYFDAQRFQLCFSQDDQEVGSANLRNLYEEYQAHSSLERPGYLKSAVRSLLALHKDVPEEFDFARHDVLPSIRNRTYFSLTEMQCWLDGYTDFAWPHWPIGEHLAMGLVYDLPEAMIMLQHDQMESWGISYYQARETALSNLAELEAAFASIDNLIYVSATEDNYDASRLIMPELVRELNIDGAPVAMVPNRDCLLITGSDSVEGLQLLANLGGETLKQPRPLSGISFCLDGDDWRPWLPHRKHPAYESLRALFVESLQREYDEQHLLLQTWYDQSSDQVQVAEYRLATGQRPRQLSSYCVWAEGQELSLPRTDRVVFASYDQPSANIESGAVYGRWQNVVEVLGDKMTEEDVYPARFRVSGFPTSEQLAAIAAT